MLPKREGFITIRWVCPIDGFLFTIMEHLCSIIGVKYSDSHVQVCFFDEVTQSLSQDKLKANVNGLFWGKPQEIHLKKRCLGMLETMTMPYHAPSIVGPITNSWGRRHYQYNTIVLVKVQLVEQCKTAKKIAKTQPLELYKVPSSQGTTPSPSRHCVRMSDEDGSHHELGHVSRVSKENKL